MHMVGRSTLNITKAAENEYFWMILIKKDTADFNLFTYVNDLHLT